MPSETTIVENDSAALKPLFICNSCITAECQLFPSLGATTLHISDAPLIHT